MLTKKKIIKIIIFIFIFFMSSLYSNDNRLQIASNAFYNNDYIFSISLLEKNRDNLTEKEKFLLALAYKNNNELEKSENLLIELLNKNLIIKNLILFHLGDINFLKKDYAKSNQYYLEIILTNTNFKQLNQKVYFNLLSNYKELENFEEAEKVLSILEKEYITSTSYYDDVFLNVPVKQDIMYERALLQIRKKAYKEAYKIMLTIISDYPNSDAAYSSVKFIFNNKKIFSHYIKAEDKVKINKVLLNKGEFKEAIKNLQPVLNYYKSHKKSKQLAEVRYLLGFSHYKLRTEKDNNKADEHFEIIEKYFPKTENLIKVLFYRGIIAQRKNDCDKLLKFMKKIINLQTDLYYCYAAYKEIINYYEINSDTEKIRETINEMLNLFYEKNNQEYYEKTIRDYFVFEYKQNNYQQCIKILEELSKIKNIDICKLNFWLAKTYKNIGDVSNYSYYIQENLKLENIEDYYFWASYLISSEETKIKIRNIFNLENYFNEYTIISLIEELSKKNELFSFLFDCKDFQDYYYFVNENTNDKLLIAAINYLNKNFGKAMIVFTQNFLKKEIKNDTSIFSKYIFFQYPLAYKFLITKYANSYQFDAALPQAIMREESRFMSKCISVAGAMGLMQIMPATAKIIANRLGEEFNDNNLLFEPEINIKYGVNELFYLFSKWYELYQNNRLAILLTASSYNAGMNATERWIKNYLEKYNDIDLFVEMIPYSETKNYVRRVFKSYNIYKYFYN